MCVFVCVLGGGGLGGFDICSDRNKSDLMTFLADRRHRLARDQLSQFDPVMRSHINNTVRIPLHDT